MATFPPRQLSGNYGADGSFAISSYMVWAAVPLAVFFFTIHMQARRSSRGGPRRSRVVVSFIGCATAALIFRGVWLTRRAYKHDTRAENFINRISALLLFTAFSLYLLSWARLLAPMQALLRSRNRRYSSAGTDAALNAIFEDSWNGVTLFARCGTLATYCCEEKKRAACVALNVVVYVISLSLTIADNARPDMELGKGGLYHGGVLLLAVLALLLSLLFLFYGMRLWWKLRTRLKTTFNAKAREKFGRTSNKVLAVSVVCIVCFGIKFLCFLWHPATGNYFPVAAFYPYFFYPPVMIHFGRMNALF